jgi:hypothetical protein
MINTYRSAFTNEKKLDSIENNLDNVVNLTQQKLKEFNNKHQDKLRENNTLKAQANIIEGDVKFLENEIAKKNLTLPLIEKEFEKVESEIQHSEKDYKVSLREYNQRNEEFLDTILQLDDEMENANAKSMEEETKKKSKYRTQYEKYKKIKDENQRLTDIMFNLRRELYLIEVSFVFLKI